MEASYKDTLQNAIKNEEFVVLLEGIEDKILERGLLTDVIPFDFYDIALVPEVYFSESDDDYRIKITVDIGTDEDYSGVSEDEYELISDTVRDILSQRGVFEHLEKLGVESADEVVDWVPVTFNVNF